MSSAAPSATHSNFSSTKLTQKKENPVEAEKMISPYFAAANKKLPNKIQAVFTTGDWNMFKTADMLYYEHNEPLPPFDLLLSTETHLKNEYFEKLIHQAFLNRGGFIVANPTIIYLALRHQPQLINEIDDKGTPFLHVVIPHLLNNLRDYLTKKSSQAGFLSGECNLFLNALVTAKNLNFNLVDSKKQTVLHVAAQLVKEASGKPKDIKFGVLSFLIFSKLVEAAAQNKFDFSQRDSNGQTIMHIIAASKSYFIPIHYPPLCVLEETIKLLKLNKVIAIGDILNLRDDNNETVLDIAEREKNEDAVRSYRIACSFSHTRV